MFVDIPRFVDCAKVFINYPVAELVLECLSNKPKQQKISFDCLLNLISYVRANSNQSAISTSREQLVGTSLGEWIELIELNKASLNVMDADSI